MLLEPRQAGGPRAADRDHDPVACDQLTDADVATVASTSGRSLLACPADPARRRADLARAGFHRPRPGDRGPRPGGRGGRGIPQHRRARQRRRPGLLRPGRGEPGLRGSRGIPWGAAWADRLPTSWPAAGPAWAVIISGLWMLVFVVALGPLLSDVPMPALAGLLILAGFGALKPKDSASSYRPASPRRGGVDHHGRHPAGPDPCRRADRRDPVPCSWSASTAPRRPTSSRSNRSTPGRWRRGESRARWPPARSPSWTSDRGVRLRSGALRRAAPTGAGPNRLSPRTATGRGGAELREHLRTNLTFTRALADYAKAISASGGTLVVCGLQPATIAQLRSAGLPESVGSSPRATPLDGSLATAYDQATTWLADAAAPYALKPAWGRAGRRAREGLSPCPAAHPSPGRRP